MFSKLLFSPRRSRKLKIVHNQEIRHWVCCFSSTTQAYHSSLIKDGSVQLLHCSNYLLKLYLEDSHPENAQKLFDEIPQRDVKTWTILISGLSRHGHHRIALDHFIKMQRGENVSPNAFTLSSVLKCCSCVHKGLVMGKAVHGWMVINQIGADVALCNAVLDVYSKHRAFDYVIKFFRLMGDKDSTSWNIVMGAYLSESNVEESLAFFQRLPNRRASSWNTIIDGLLQRGFEEKALGLLYEMVKAGVLFSEVTFSISLVLASSLKKLELGKQIHGRLFRIGMNEDAFASASLIDMYCKCNRMEDASIVFRNLRFSESYRTNLMTQKVSWSTLIAGYVQNGMLKDALACFTSMIHERLEVDLFTLTTIITACADAILLVLGQQIHAYTLKFGHEQDIFFSSSMIDMYAKCGELDKALSVFQQTKSRNVVLWSVMISSYGMNGLGREAIRLFELMQNEGIRPNEVTLLGLLSACSHSGLVEDGCKYFRMMKELYGIEPGIQHFACMVDLFGRAGHLKEIEDFVYGNGVYNSTEVWKAYLSSCWIHKNAEMVNWVSKKLLELQPNETGAHLMMSNTYSANHAWEDAAKSRGLVRRKETRKAPGQSWVSI